MICDKDTVMNSNLLIEGGKIYYAGLNKSTADQITMAEVLQEQNLIFASDLKIKRI